MPSTKSQIFIATLAILTGSILSSVTAAPLASHGAVLSHATNQVAKVGISAVDQHANNIYKAEAATA